MPLRALEVEAHAALAGVEHDEGRGVLAAGAVSGGLAGEGLDLDDLGAEVGQEQAAVGHVIDLAELEDGDAIEGVVGHGETSVGNPPRDACDETLVILETPVAAASASVVH